ncbi:lysophospholipid acyltransferase family protein [Spirulina major]|uniref:lysophospholipid acyltransferase family protein n=1 Tax=Spirulina major TaxID=270636 RepID=UPI000A026F18|nr:lysophospholipid acyltransferase family protein [Spirulina major]
MDSRLFADLPLVLSQGLLSSLGIAIQVDHRERCPKTGPVLVISNHRSLLDAPLIMAAIARPVRFACHHYMSHVPLFKDLVAAYGAFPLDAPHTNPPQFRQQAIAFLQAGQVVGLFPEGGEPMVTLSSPQAIQGFHRGFAHLAYQAPVPLAVLPIAIASRRETCNPRFAPFSIFHFFAPDEPLFDRPGWHPSVQYQQVKITVGRPLWITPETRQQYHGRAGVRLAKTLTRTCHAEIAQLLHDSYA